MKNHPIVSREKWLIERRALLEKEKAFTAIRDELSQLRRQLPWLKVETDYRFEGPNGEQLLTELFGNHSQLIVYHFMYGPEWEEGCPSCSFWADNFDPAIIHLNHRNIAMVAISRAPYEKLAKYKQRMGWSFDWLSSYNSDFNFDYHVSFTAKEIESGAMYYNYHMTKAPSEAPGVSVFYRDEAGDIFHTYSCYARGLDMLNGTYQHMDITPEGRNESELAFPMAWVRRHDQYD